MKFNKKICQDEDPWAMRVVNAYQNHNTVDSEVRKRGFIHEEREVNKLVNRFNSPERTVKPKFCSPSRPKVGTTKDELKEMRIEKYLRTASKNDKRDR